MPFSTLQRSSICALRPGFQLQRAVTRFLFTETDPSSEAPPPLQQKLHAELTSRPLNKACDKITSQPWTFLNISLADFLPPSCHASNFNDGRLEFLDHNVVYNNIRTSLPQSHHLVYFPPPVLDSELINDGTDSLHSPGAPFVKRLWAGGSLVFNHLEKFHLKANKAAVCGEEISNVTVKGINGQEKVFVTVHRRMASLSNLKQEKNMLMNMKKQAMHKNYGLDHIGPWALIETRDLVFLREKSKEEVREDLLKVAKLVKPIHTPDFSVSLTPNAALLFRFSALSFNAHRIHLDPEYTREVEGHRNLLVHGPLTLVLMLSVLRSQVPEGKMILRFDYRNWAPLYVDEEMKICVRRGLENEDKFDVWIEGSDGAYAVKARAVVGNVEMHTKVSKPDDSLSRKASQRWLTVEERKIVNKYHLHEDTE